MCIRDRFNIVNSISMSVSARIKQYGAMRAVGMDNRQLKRMISAEAYTLSLIHISLAAIWLLGKVQSLKFAIQDWAYG